ncbi:MAG: hypothetical protein JWN46_281 [Acidimicrobiales bacterium]|nr:hypothetical protein [Acidimicrobiales bacterium]
MEWVETTGKSIEAAKDAALDQLGIHEDDAEFEILEEPRPGLFGRMRGEARIRARVAPKAPRPKQDRRERRRKGAGTGSGPEPKAATSGGARRGGRSKAAAPTIGSETDESESAEQAAAAKPRAARRGGGRRQAGARTGGGPTDRPTKAALSDEGEAATSGEEGEDMTEDDVTVEQQADIIEAFLDGLLEAFDADGEIRRSQLDDETIELAIEGDDLGLLIGPKGQTLAAVQDLARTVLQRQATGRHHGRVRIDVSGYRQRRQEALARFTIQVADQVRESGVQKALEPMAAPDRKVVHDTVNELAGVETISEGEEPRRRVVIVPADS